VTVDWQKLALAETHELRIQILELFDGSDIPLSPKQLAGLTDEPIGNVSYHCNALRDAGLIELHHTEPVRGALAHYYGLADS
jgi:DNA-binding transcriptional ArsR family regulator